MEFLGEKVNGVFTAQKIRGETLHHPNYIPSAAVLQVNCNQSKSGRKDRHTREPFCVFCESKGHWAQECKKVMEVSECREKLKSAQCCFLRLNRGHNARVCCKRGRALCTRCKGAHHRAIWNEAGAATTRTREIAPTSVGKIDVASPGFTFLQTACVWVVRPTGLSKLTRCVLDGGSQSSFIAKTLIDDLKLEVVDHRDFVVSAFESLSSDSGPCRVARFCAKSIWKNITVPITAFESTHALCPHPTVPHDISIMAQTRKIQLADPREGERDLPSDVLIGGDYYWRIVQDASTIRLSLSLVLLPTKFGWILTRNRMGITANEIMVNHITLEHLDNDLRRFWDLETIRITPSQEKTMTTGDSQILQEFCDSYRIEDVRRVKRLPKNTCGLRIVTLQKAGSVPSTSDHHKMTLVVQSTKITC